MLKQLKICTILIIVVVIAYVSRTSFKSKIGLISDLLLSEYFAISNSTNSFSASTILREGNGILFMETTDKMNPPSLVLCAIESAARVYPDRPVVFFMKGLEDITSEEDEKRAKQQFPALSSYSNVYLFPLRMDQLFNNTPLKPWFDKINPKKEVYWTHVSSDACRFALMWKYGGIYMDADVISLRPIPQDHFLADQDVAVTSSSVFGLSPHYQLAWQFMENFVENYRGEIWGHQGPGVFTRVVKKLCGIPVFKSKDDVMCGNISYFHHQRFYPIKYPSWRRYFDVWENLSTFNDSYALHLWNFMNKEGKSMVPGSNTLVELLYQKQCPTTYEYILRNKSTHLSNSTNSFSASTILREGNGILFMETTDKMNPPSLVLCAIESAARVYPGRPVVFFMKGLEDITSEEDEKRAKQQFPTLSSYSNVYLFPLRMDQLFNNTPLKPWFDKVNPEKEVYWTHVSSDACRFALMWKYGGIYMDADVISLRPIPQDHFIAAQDATITSSSVFGLSSHYQLTWQFMENFVENYRGEIWGHQGPGVFTRVVNKLCGMPVFKSTDDVMCGNISYFHPQRFYPINYPSWRRYFDVWENLSTFNDSYALHLWNFMNKEGKSMIPGSNTLVELLYQKQCPTTYEYILRNKSTHL